MTSNWGIGKLYKQRKINNSTLARDLLKDEHRLVEIFHLVKITKSIFYASFVEKSDQTENRKINFIQIQNTELNNITKNWY